MIRFVVLDSGVIGLITHPNPTRQALECLKWVADLRTQGETVVLPEITDYEVRRTYLRRKATTQLASLNALPGRLLFHPITTPVMQQAAAFWAQARQLGQQTAPDSALDVDMILAAHAAILAERGYPVLVATTNVRHLGRFAAARSWQAIVPGQA